MYIGNYNNIPHDAKSLIVDSGDKLFTSFRIPLKVLDNALLPAPVLTAVIAMTFLLLFSMVSLGPSSTKLAPFACERDARCITYACETSE